MADLRELQNKVGDIADRAAERADANLHGELTQLTKLTSDQIREYFPDPADEKRLLDLMRIVRASTGRNEKITKLVSNAENFAGIVLTLLTKIA